MFSGIGGFELGIENSNVTMESVGHCEVDKYAESIFSVHFPKSRNFGDATEINTRELPDFDFLVGGFPCQAFSLAGKRKGFEDTRGTLFFEIARVLKDKKPTYFLLENVKGLLSHDGGRTFKKILGVCDELGYDVSWAIYNSKDFGVPQNRERVFIKGCFRGKGRLEVLFKSGTSREITPVEGEVSNTYWGTRQGRIHKTDELMNTLTNNGQNDGSRQLIQLNDKAQAQTVYDTGGLACTLSANGGGQGGKTGLYKVDKCWGSTAPHASITDGSYTPCLCANNIGVSTPVVGEKKISKCYGSMQEHCAETDGTYSPTLTSAMGEGGGHIPMIEEECEIKKVGNISPSNHHNGDVFDENGISRTILARDYKDSVKVRTATKKGYEEAYVGDGVRLDHPEGATGRGRTQKDGTGAISCACDWGTLDTDYRIRRLTPKECERLQGFPDDYTKYGVDGEVISDTQRYKCLGNAVTTNVITWLINGMFG